MLLSYSSINRFKQCRRWFYKKHIELAPPEFPKGHIYQKGIDFHSNMELALSFGVTPDFKSQETIDKWKEVMSLISGLVLFIEQSFYLDNNMELHHDYTPDAWFTGKADVIAYTPSEELYIIEFKNSFENEEEVYNQLITYASAYYINQKNFKAFIFTPFKCYERELKLEEILLKRKELQEIRQNITKFLNSPSKDLSPTAGSHCFFCEYINSCPAYQSLAYKDSFDPETLPKRLLQLENELTNLRNLAKFMIESGYKVQHNNVSYLLELVENIEVSPSQVIKVLKEKGIDPFGEDIISVFSVNIEALKKIALKYGIDFSEFYPTFKAYTRLSRKNG